MIMMVGSNTVLATVASLNIMWITLHLIALTFPCQQGQVTGTII